MDMELATAAAQFGTAGLIGWMWLTERRAAAERDRQVAELHERLMQERECVTACLDALQANTKAITTLEGTQRALAQTIERLRPTRAARSRVGAGAASKGAAAA